MTIDYKPLAIDGGANVESQAQFLLDLGPGGVLEHGFLAGTAASAKVNKVLRQSSVMTAAVANAVSQLLGGTDVLDDGDVAALTAKLILAMTGSSWTTGDVKLTMKTVADSGWIMANDGTIGSGASGATNANDANQALFLLLWTNVADAWAPVVTGRGGSAAADWAANKRITLTKMLGRALAISGAGLGLTARALGENLGSQDAVVVDHTHSTHFDFQFLAGGAAPNILVYPGSGSPGADLATGGATGGTSGVGKNMQPSGFLNAMIKR